jgi:imidazolonepropionase-like amidohydrolase
MKEGTTMRTVLKGGTVLDLVGQTKAPATLVIEKDKIAEIGPDVAGQPGDTVIDVTGSFLLPGMMNCHSHIGWDGKRDLQLQAELPDEVTVWTAAMNLHRTLSAGVTTIRDLGMNGVGPLAKRAIDEGIAPYLRLFANGRAICTTGGHTWWCCREADGVDDCRRAIREQARAGATWIKIMGSHELPQFTMAELEAMVDEGHMNGLKVTAHATFDEAIRRVVQAGVDCVEHGGSMSEDTIKMMLDRKTWIVTTFSPLVLQATRGLAAGMPEHEVERRKRQMAEPERFAGNRAAAAAGIPIAFGTDAGSPVVPHNEIVEELKFMVGIGVCDDSWAALRSITIRAAELLGIDGTLGTLATGKTADVVVVGKDPVDDLEGLRSIQRVYVRGELAIGPSGGYAQVW